MTPPKAGQEPPERLRQLGESQRARDVRRCELEAVRHKAREPLSSGFPIVVCEGDPEWATVRTWFFRAAPEGLGASPQMSPSPTRILLTRQGVMSQDGKLVVSGDGGWYVEATAYQVAGNGQRRVIGLYKDVISTERFYASWGDPKQQQTGSTSHKEIDHG